MNITARTFPGHEVDLGGPVRAFEERVREWLDREREAMSPEQRAATQRRTLGFVADVFRRGGIPATGARFEGDAIVVDVAEPRGFG